MIWSLHIVPVRIRHDCLKKFSEAKNCNSGLSCRGKMCLLQVPSCLQFKFFPISQFGGNFFEFLKRNGLEGGKVPLVQGIGLEDSSAKELPSSLGLFSPNGWLECPLLWVFEETLIESVLKVFPSSRLNPESSTGGNDLVRGYGGRNVPPPAAVLRKHPSRRNRLWFC